MRVAFDLDGVLADLHASFARAASELFPGMDADVLASPSTGSSPPPMDGAEDGGDAPETESRPKLTRSQLSAVWNRLCSVENYWETLEEIEPGTVARIWSLAETRRWEVIFLTSRPAAPGLTIQRQTQQWLARHGFPLPSVFVVEQSRGRIADALQLDVVVDDRPEGCLDVVLESKARGILVWRGEASAVPASAKRLGIGVVLSMAACLEVLVEADRAGGSQEGFMATLRGLLGLKARSREA
jgi:hypothetical protein